MHDRRHLVSFALILGLGFALAACGSSSTAPPPRPPADGGDPPVLDGAVVYADAGCGSCHGDDGSSGFGADLGCLPVDGLDAYVRDAASAHAGGHAPDLTDAELAALAEFLGGDTCASNVPASHADERNGVFHRPGESASCAPCHGEDGEGRGSIPSCATCHGGGGALTCTGCHAVGQDDGDGVPALGRRAVTGELSLTSHHLGADWTDADCEVCHDMSEHRQGAVRLVNVDDPSDVIVLAGDPATDADEAVKLEGFCLACHDADGADGNAPFSDGAWPTPVDDTAWGDASHQVAQLTCMGDGATFGCHASGHGSNKRALLAPSAGDTDGPGGDAGREEEGFCFACHTADGAATSDVEAAFGLTSHHLVSSEEQGQDVQLECTSCHDPHRASSSAMLRDPDDGGAWSGTMQAFCLTCHDGDPPSGVAFPSTSDGTGWDKSGFAGTTHASELGQDSCVDCHDPHGTAYVALLAGNYVMTETNQLQTSDYGACWDCHSSSNILTGRNAFGERHKKHVDDEDTACIFCHDVHGGYDSGEQGLVSFVYARAQGWGPTFDAGVTNSSAFYVNQTGTRGYCALRCHGENHNPESYVIPAGN